MKPCQIMASLLLSNKKVQKLALKKDVTRDTMQMLSKLAMQSNITIKKKLLLKNCNSLIRPNVAFKGIAKQMDAQTSNNPKVSPEVTQAEGRQVKKLEVKIKVGQSNRMDVPEQKEYYPEKRKRNVQMNKVVLKPKHDYKVVATTNKRKRRTPHKGVDPPRSATPDLLMESRDLTLAELVCLADEQGLDDDDLMEILTCPSPVWWEEHSDEEEVRIRLDADSEEESTEHQDSLTHKKDNKATTDANANKITTDYTKKSPKSDINFFKKFVAKRSKLEKVLGNIKCKKPPDATGVNKENRLKDEEKIVTNEMKIPDNEIKILSNDESKESADSSIDNENDTTNKVRNDSGSGLSDVSMNEELLSTLESVEIPVKDIKTVEIEIKNEMINKNDYVQNAPNIVKKAETVVNKYEFIRKRTRKPNRKYEFEPNELKRFREKNEVQVTKINLGVVPPDLPPLTKNPFKNKPRVYGSPKSLLNINSNATSPNIIEFDSISDKNITFLDEYVDNKTEPVEAVNVNKYGEGKDGEMVTVYQIVSNKPDNTDVDIEAQIKVNLVNKSPQTSDISSGRNNGKINAFYKTRKTTYRSKSKYKKV